MIIKTRNFYFSNNNVINDTICLSVSGQVIQNVGDLLGVVAFEGL